jgi:hypothetical protein
MGKQIDRAMEKWAQAQGRSDGGRPAHRIDYDRADSDPNYARGATRGWLRKNGR